MPNGSVGHPLRRGRQGRWNLRLDGIEPALTLLGRGDAERVAVDLPRFDVGETDGGGVDAPRRARRCASAASS